MKMKKRRKSGRYRGSQTAKRGKKNRTRGSGSQGGVGLAGTGKRGDQKKTLVIKMTGGNNYFGKDKALRCGNRSTKLEVINLNDIEVKFKGDGLINLTGYKILGDGEIKSKLKIKATSASKSAVEKIKKAGGEITIERLKEDKDNNTKKSNKNVK
jgi:large subunit ribosomal protein L15